MTAIYYTRLELSIRIGLIEYNRAAVLAQFTLRTRGGSRGGGGGGAPASLRNDTSQAALRPALFSGEPVVTELSLVDTTANSGRRSRRLRKIIAGGLAIPLFVGRLIGVGIMAVLYGALALPLVAALLIATNRLRYRGWLAGPAFVFSLISLQLSSDFVYNLMHWTKSRPTAVESALTVALLGASPLFLIGVILRRSPRRGAWIAAMLPLMGLTGWGIQQNYKDRSQRDLAEYQQGLALLRPETGTLFTRCEVKHRVTGGVAFDEVYVRGHVPQGARVTLLADPFSRNFRPRYCTGIAGSYRPADSDPAVMGNVTEVGSLEGCDPTTIYNSAVIQRTVTEYKAVSVQRFSSQPELSGPVIRTSFQKFRYNPTDFDVAHAVGSRATGGRGENLFVSALKPLHTPPNAFPCTDPALVLSIQSAERVQAVLPYCVLSWNLFELNDELYFAATTQEPIPPGDVMGPDWTLWLFRVEHSALRQIWPKP